MTEYGVSIVETKQVSDKSKSIFFTTPLGIFYEFI